MAEDLLKYIALGLIIYTFIPTILARFFGLAAVNRLPDKGKVIITFDDGPDPKYTLRVLDILRASRVKACFFVIGEKAHRYPDIIKKIVSEGHEIGNHGFRHHVPWFLGPIKTVLDINKSSQIIEEISGSPPAAFRPPWGLFNLSSFIARFIIKQKFILWSFISWDWTKGTTPEKLITKVQKKVKDGSILIFHDSDTVPGASSRSPEKMISALPEIINILKTRGYKIITLSETLWHRTPSTGKLLNCLWQTWDNFFRLTFNIIDVTTTDGNPTIFRTSVRRYLGPSVNMGSKEVLSYGEKVCELHINNEFIMNYLDGESRTEKIAIKIVRELRRSLPVLAAHIRKDPRFMDTRFLVGITILHRGSSMMGFTPMEIPSPLVEKIISFYQGMILKLCHPSGKDRTFGKGNISAKIVVMSKSTLCSKYLALPAD